MLVTFRLLFRRGFCACCGFGWNGQAARLLHGGQGRKRSEEELLKAQLSYAIEAEMTVTAADFLRLRTGWTYFQVKKAEAKAETVIRLMGDALGWSEAERERERAEVRQLLETIYRLPENEESLAQA